MVKNNRFLIDTHIFIWWMEKSKFLSKDRYEILNNPDMQIFLSVASIWEMIIKENKKKLKYSINLEEGIKASGFTLLPITLPHVLALQELSFHHNDPFDRIMLAQTTVEKLTFISDDAKMKNYDITLL
jgi:PIN domain nuclease of toxin-antitoxin system